MDIDQVWLLGFLINSTKKQLLPFLAIIFFLLGEPIKPLKISEPIDSLFGQMSMRLFVQ